MADKILTIDDKVAVYKAFLEGKQIQAISKTMIGAEWADVEYPNWDWENCLFRIKPQKKVVPYDSVDEFLAAMKEHGPLIKLSDDEDWFVYMAIANVNMDKTICVNNCLNSVEEVSFEALSKESYTWQDGHVIGKEIEV